MKISASRARRLILRCQGLDSSWELPEGKERAAQTIERLGYVQIDTIAVIERAHHHTLWSRFPDYRPE
ncbi:MAG: winged helix DNA-binding domain-containing protein, partial [Candidatus Poribacteria bacterium]|nr:winged helix DNA-binding domain-containing protein [Candidatus Poribacteria bacterium]